MGLDLVVDQVDGRVLRLRFQAGEFDAVIQSFWNHPDNHLHWFGPGIEPRRQRPVSEILGYRNPEVARLLAAARASFDLAERDRL